MHSFQLWLIPYLHCRRVADSSRSADMIIRFVKCKSIEEVFLLPICGDKFLILKNASAAECGRSWVRTRSGQTIDYKIGICCFSAKHATLRRKSKDWLGRNQNNVSEWSHMSIRGMLFQCASTIQIQLSVLV
jgi:hypothetical protein